MLNHTNVRKREREGGKGVVPEEKIRTTTPSRLGLYEGGLPRTKLRSVVDGLITRRTFANEALKGSLGGLRHLLPGTARATFFFEGLLVREFERLLRENPKLGDAVITAPLDMRSVLFTSEELRNNYSTNEVVTTYDYLSSLLVTSPRLVSLSSLESLFFDGEDERHAEFLERYAWERETTPKNPDGFSRGMRETAALLTYGGNSLDEAFRRLAFYVREIMLAKGGENEGVEGTPIEKKRREKKEKRYDD